MSLSIVPWKPIIFCVSILIYRPDGYSGNDPSGSSHGMESRPDRGWGDSASDRGVSYAHPGWRGRHAGHPAGARCMPGEPGRPSGARGLSYFLRRPADEPVRNHLAWIGTGQNPSTQKSRNQLVSSDRHRQPLVRRQADGRFLSVGRGRREGEPLHPARIRAGSAPDRWGARPAGRGNRSGTHRVERGFAGSETIPAPGSAA